MDEWSISKLEKDDGSYWIIRKNLHPVSEGRQFDDYPICTYFTVHYQPYTEDGFPSPGDNDAFEAIEDELASICDGKHSVFVATVFMPGLKDFIVYTSNPDQLSDLIESLVSSYGQFKSEFGGNKDPNWSQYESFA
jgi:hypothetical protein